MQITPNPLIHVFMDLALCTGAQSCWNRKGTSPTCSYKVGSMKLSKISLYTDALRVPLTGTKGPRPTPEKQPHTIIPPPPNDLEGWPSTFGNIVWMSKFGVEELDLIPIEHLWDELETRLRARPSRLHQCLTSQMRFWKNGQTFP